jgi:(2R)-ethylmalonyl-CoA mutase
MTRDVLVKMKEAGLGHIPVIVGGIIPPEDAEQLRAEGVAAIYTPKDFVINRIIEDIVGQVERNLLLERGAAEASVREAPLTAANP